MQLFYVKTHSNDITRWFISQYVLSFKKLTSKAQFKVQKAGWTTERTDRTISLGSNCGPGTGPIKYGAPTRPYFPTSLSFRTVTVIWSGPFIHYHLRIEFPGLNRACAIGLVDIDPWTKISSKKNDLLCWRSNSVCFDRKYKVYQCMTHSTWGFIVAPKKRWISRLHLFLLHHHCFKIAAAPISPIFGNTLAPISYPPPYFFLRLNFFVSLKTTEVRKVVIPKPRSLFGRTRIWFWRIQAVQKPTVLKATLQTHCNTLKLTFWKRNQTSKNNKKHK